MMISKRHISLHIVSILFLQLGIIGGWRLLQDSSGIWTWALLTIILAALLLCIREIHLLTLRLFHREGKLSAYWNVLLLVCSIMLILTAFEGVLRIQA